MIRTWLSLVPADRRGKVVAYTVLALISVVVRAVATVLLVPLLAALFSDTPQRASSPRGGTRVSELLHTNRGQLTPMLRAAAGCWVPCIR